MPRPDGQSLQHARPAPVVRIHVSQWAFALWWVGLLLLHAVNVSYYCGVAIVYVGLVNTYMEFQLELYSIAIPKSAYGTISNIGACIAAVHALFIVVMVVSSIHARKLVFQPQLTAIYREMRRAPYIGRVLRRQSGRSQTTDSRTRPARRPSSRLQSITNAAKRTGSFLLARDGLLGVDSVYFDHLLVVREVVETSLQTHQLYRMTQVLPRLWLIRFYVVLIVANCWAVPFLHRYYRRRETTRRLLCLLCDAVLDMVSSIGVSIIIFATYAPQYNDPNGYGFPFITWFDDEWFANMQQEFQIMLVASWGDLASRFVFAIGLVQCMEAIKEMLTPPPTKSTSFEPAIVPQEAARTSSLKAMSAVASHPVLGEPPTKAKTTSSTVRATSIKLAHRAWAAFLVHVCAPALFILWGCAILIVHLRAEVTSSSSACALRLKPWLTTKPACSLVEINCARLDMAAQSSSVAMETAWTTFDPDHASRVVIRHCPELTLSSDISNYHRMTDFKVYNSTVVEWSDGAALTHANHPGLRAIYIVRTNFARGELPPGLLSPNFPRGVVNCITSVTNLESLPSTLASLWPRGMQLAFEFARLTAIPEAVVELEPTMVSVAGSPVVSVSAKLFESPRLKILCLTRTHVQTLPRDVAIVNPQFVAVLVQFTNISTFWSWLDNYAHYTTLLPVRLFNAYGTPYCRELAEIVAGNRTSFSVPADPKFGIMMDVSTPEKLAFIRKAIECTAPGNMGYFPLPYEDAKHGLL